MNKKKTSDDTLLSSNAFSFPIMEHTGFEPVALTMRMLRAPNCANAPFIIFLLYLYARICCRFAMHTPHPKSIIIIP